MATGNKKDALRRQFIRFIILLRFKAAAERRQWFSAASRPRRKTRVKLWFHQIMGYTVHRVTEFRPNTVLFSRENEKLTVSTLQTALSHVIEAIVKKNSAIERYSVALKVLRTIQVRFANGQPRKPSKKDFQIACEVCGEIQKDYAITQTQKDNIDAATSWCKLCIEWFMRD